VGLDFAVKTPREKQEEVLKRLLSLAFRERKPVLLHARRAWGEAFQLLKSFPLERAVFHWYSGPLDVLQKVFEQGYFISATPAAAYSERHRAAIEAAPVSRLVLETDAPEVYRGVPSEPRDLRKTLQSVSEVKGMEAEELARHTYRNAIDFFQIPQPKEKSDE
jgi:TatD DNase family protein